MLRRLPVLLTWLTLAAGPRPGPITVQVTPQVCLAPCVVTVRVRVEPHPDNRAYWIVVDGGDLYYTSTVWQLDGDHAAVTQSERRYRLTAAGRYTVAAGVVRIGQGEAGREVRTVEVSGER